MTCFRLQGGRRASASDVRASLPYFPLIGLILGGLLAGFDWAARDLWPAGIVGVLEAAWLAVLTRAFHLKGLAHAVDAVGSRTSTSKMVSMMKAPHVGSFGVVAVVLVLLGKAYALTGLSSETRWQLLVLVPCLSRWAFQVLAASIEPPPGVGSGLAGVRNRSGLTLGGPIALAGAWALMGPWGVAGFALAGLWSLAAAALWRRKVGWATEEVLGAHLEVTEAILFVLGGLVP